MVKTLIKNFEPEIDSISLQPSDGGRFEVEVNGSLVYSKLQTGRHAEPGEVLGQVRKILSQ
ncbi:MAG TPA: hypothetical protein DIS70_03895 [Anaerolineae bacterium]|nr:hypothetical protein [Anaerolineae bacterium]